MALGEASPGQVSKGRPKLLAPGRTLRLRWLGGHVSYRDAHALQRSLWAAGVSADDWLLLLEHAHVYTAGIRTNPEHMLVDPASVGAELLWVDRGGDITYHGPGQLVGYPVLSVLSGPSATPCYVHEVEQVVIDALVQVGLPNVGRLDGYPGVWVDPDGPSPRKICAVGARHSRQRTMHGFALNVRPDMAMFSHIVPCGIAGKDVTSLAAEGVEVSMADMVETVFEVATQYWGVGRAVERQDAAMPASMRGPAGGAGVLAGEAWGDGPARVSAELAGGGAEVAGGGAEVAGAEGEVGSADGAGITPATVGPRPEALPATPTALVPTPAALPNDHGGLLSVQTAGFGAVFDQNGQKSRRDSQSAPRVGQHEPAPSFSSQPAPLPGSLETQGAPEAPTTSPAGATTSPAGATTSPAGATTSPAGATPSRPVRLLGRLGKLAEAGVDPAGALPLEARKPPWLRANAHMGSEFRSLRKTVRGLGLVTVCEEAGCPNIFECWADGTATFMINGERCTRACGFCQVDTAKPLPLDPGEPERVAEAVARLGLAHAVVTCVARDDLADGGASGFAETIDAIRRRCPATAVEVLISDCKGDPVSLDRIFQRRPDVLNHNVETVPRLQRAVRPSASYTRSLAVLARARHAGLTTKSGLMLGLGETEEEVLGVLADLQAIGVAIVTIGQYLRPSAHHLPVARWWPPEDFARIAEAGRALGLPQVVSSPLTRSSYHARQSAAGAGAGTTSDLNVAAAGPSGVSSLDGEPARAAGGVA